MKITTEIPFFENFGDSISFNDPSECRPEASQIAWWPESIEFRQHKPLEERFFLNLYLRWVFEKAPFQFETPLQITRADRHCQPDFEACENDRRYGLEVTRTTTMRLEWATNTLIKKGSGYSLSLNSDLNGEDPSFDPESGISKDGSPIYDEPLLGLDSEEEWARLTAHRILEKQKKLNDNYSRFYPTSDLVLYSAWSIYDLESAIQLLHRQYAMQQLEALPIMSFQRIAIVCESWAIFEPLNNIHQIFTSDGYNFL